MQEGVCIINDKLLDDKLDEQQAYISSEGAHGSLLDLSGYKIIGKIFVNLDLSGMIANTAIFEDCTFDNCLLFGVECIESKFENTKIVGSKLFKSQIYNSIFINVVFYKSSFRNTEFYGSIFNNSNIGEAVIVNCDF